MKGNNVLYLNEGTMMEIVQIHLNTMLKNERVVVTTVEQNISGESQGMFRIVFSSDEDEGLA